jgi:hypothetical protein|tara:strand:+ start:557 stop:766 length:210 start_codon:yes stop_codon:yes gene_type:complete
MKKVYDFIGGRKLTFALVLTVLATIFVWYSKSTAAEWSNFMIWTFGTYALGNVGEYFGKGLSKNNKGAK